MVTPFFLRRHRHTATRWAAWCAQGESLRIVGVEPPPPGCQPTFLQLKSSTMQIVRLPLRYDGNFEEVMDDDRFYTPRTNYKHFRVEALGGVAQSLVNVGLWLTDFPLSITVDM